MKIILFGTTGMVGQGVLRECLIDPAITQVLSVGRTPLGIEHEKLKEIIHSDFTDFSTVETHLSTYEGCFFSLGVSAAGKTETEYARLTYDITLSAATTLARVNPNMTFIYVSGAGTDSTEKGRVMWARVKGKTENALLRLPFKAAYMFRPGIIMPLHGIRSKTKLYQTFYDLLGWTLPTMRRVFPNQVTTTEAVGRAAIAAIRHGAPAPVLEAADINQLAMGMP